MKTSLTFHFILQLTWTLLIHPHKLLTSVFLQHLWVKKIPKSHNIFCRKKLKYRSNVTNEANDIIIEAIHQYPSADYSYNEQKSNVITQERPENNTSSINLLLSVT